jgi:DNA-binding response OmpR family regulator
VKPTQSGRFFLLGDLRNWKVERVLRSSSVTKVKILAVEDEPRIREVYYRALTSEGYRVDFAQNGAAAQSMLMEEDYDLLLVDIKTPVMDGKQLYHYIEDRYPELVNRVIFTTGDVMSNDTQDFLKQTGRPFLPKPFSPDELNTLVRETLGRLH